jgi:hypothetical protein
MAKLLLKFLEPLHNALFNWMGRAGLILFCAPSPPDTSAQTALQGQITNRQLDMADRAYADQKALTDQFLPLFQQQAQLSVDQQAKTNQRADQQWQNYVDNFQPMEAQFAKTAADYNTPGRQQQAAEQAQAGVAGAFDRQRAQQADQLQGAGIMPGSGRSLTLSNATGIEEAKALAAAGNDARRQTEATGLSLQNTAIGIGRGQVAGGLQAADLALRQGSSAQGSAGGAVQLAGAPYGTSAGLLGGASSSNLGAVDILNSDYRNQLGQYGANTGFIGDILGAAGKAYGMRSSRKLKHVSGKSDKKLSLAAIKASPSHDWAYKPGMGDGSTKPRQGPIAEDLHKVAPHVSNGKGIDPISMLGLHHSGIGAVDDKVASLGKKVDKLTQAVTALKRLTLADAKDDAKTETADAANDAKMMPPKRRLSLATARSA